MINKFKLEGSGEKADDAIDYDDNDDTSSSSSSSEDEELTAGNVAANGIHNGGRNLPHKQLRKLRLFDTPHTPKTLMKKADTVMMSKSGKITIASPIGAGE